MTKVIRKIAIRYWLAIAVVLFFIGTHFINLNRLPVFADEAIYIRWAQLMRQDFDRYKFFPIQDGKPPLHMMILTGFLPLSPLDPLLASRLLSVISAAITALLLSRIVKQLGARRLTQFLTAILYFMLPFTLFHNRLGLIDPLLTMFLSGTFLGVLRLCKKPSYRWSIVTGILLGLSLWTKTATLMMLPIPIIALMYHSNRAGLTKKIIHIAIAGIIGGIIFAGLKLDPSFSSLFTRSSDFTFSISTVLSGKLDHISGNILKITRWSLTYLTLGGLITIGASIITSDRSYARKRNLLVFCTLVFTAPFVIFGKTIASRYLLPTSIFLIPLITLSWEHVWTTKPKWITQLLISAVVVQSAWFGSNLIFSSDNTPVPHEDKVQYFAEWSSGHGIAEVRDFIKDQTKNGKVTVATEGFFGTLPDGLLMYFDQAPEISKLEIYGIGQPLYEIPSDLLDSAKDHNTYILANSHRWFVYSENCCELIHAYDRPHDGPSLLLFQVK